MRVLYLTPGAFDKGGISRYSRYSVRAISGAFGAGSVRVLSLMGRGPDDLETPFEVAYSGAMPVSRLSRLMFALAAFKEASRFRPTHVVSAHVHLAPIAVPLARKHGAEVLQMVYGVELWPTHGLSTVRRWALAAAETVVADSNATAQQVVSRGLASHKPAVLWDCVDVDRFSPGPPRWDRLRRYQLAASRRFRLLFLGRLTDDARYKGVERLLQLLACLPAAKYEAIIAGTGALSGQLRARAAELGLMDRIVFAGSVHEDDLPDLYRAADVLYLTSEVGPGKGEGIPLVPMEAMACGTPILVGNEDGSRELLHKGGGWCGDPTDLAGQEAYVRALAADRRLVASERVAARERAVGAFSFGRFQAELQSLLLSVR